MSRPPALRALLLDLDGTLLENDMDTFVPAYLRALASFAAPLVAPDRLIPVLLAATGAMNRNDGTGPTNQEAFAAAFYPALGRERSELEPVFARFYAERFAELRPLTRPAPGARELVELAFARRLQVVVATNPLFPATAIEQRLAWAGVGADRHPYALVTTYETMHATKDHSAYYEEILGRLGRRPDECLMAGDDWDWDIAPALHLGLAAYWVAAPDATAPEPAAPLVGRGDLTGLRDWLDAATRAV